MKKSLLAFAVIGASAASAQAQTNVTIGGFLAVQAKEYAVSNVNTIVRTAGQRLNKEYRLDDDASSRIFFAAKEDLGSGSDAHVYMESRFGGDNGSSASTFGLAAGDTFIGLGSTAWGVLDFGRISASIYKQGEQIEADRTGSSGNSGSVSFLSDIGSFGISKSRMNNMIRYKTPVLSGFQGTLAASPSIGEEGKVTSATAAINNQYSDGQAALFAGSYTNGGFYLNAAYWNLNAEGRPGSSVAAPNTGFTSMANADQHVMRLSSSYTFPFGLKVGFSADKSLLRNVAGGAFMGSLTTALQGGGSVTAKGAVQRTAWLLPISYTAGQHAFYAKYGRAGNLSNWTTPIAQAGGTGARFYELAYDYALSKRTAVGVSYMALRNDGNGVYQPYQAGTTTGSLLFAGEAASSAQLNLKHSF